MELPGMKLQDFVLVKAIFNQRMSNAILERDEARIRKIIDDECRYEQENGFFKDAKLDIEQMYEIHLKDINDEDLLRRLL